MFILLCSGSLAEQAISLHRRALIGIFAMVEAPGWGRTPNGHLGPNICHSGRGHSFASQKRRWRL
jgi:hypothetical protein